MGVYKKAVITEAGEALAARAVSGEVTIQFSHAGTSSYAYSEGTNLKKLTELQDVKQTVIPSNVQIANDTLISIRSMFDNSEITQEYLIQNVGIYASDGETEILFAVCQAATPDQMPAFNGVAPSSFIYNVQISIAQAEQLSISISTAGAATVQDVLDLEKKMEEKKLDSSGGDASDTVASVEEPDSEEEKYPDIGSKGSMKNILGNLYRWVKNLKADKVDSAGGDTAETVVSEFEASFENFPVPAAKEKAKTRWGKVKKFGDDFKAWMTGVCLLGHIVNNCVTNNPNLPLSAAQGKALMDLYTVLNTKLSEKNNQIRYQTRSDDADEQHILSDGLIMGSNEPTIPFDCYVIAHHHITLKSSARNARVYWMLGGAYIQGTESWDGTASQEYAFDKTFIYEATAGQIIQLKMYDSNNVGIISRGNNNSLNRHSFIFIPK